MNMKEIKMRARKGATFIEYALLAGLVAIVVAAAAMLFGDRLRGLFSKPRATTQTVTKTVDAVKLDKSKDKAVETMNKVGEEE